MSNGLLPNKRGLRTLTGEDLTRLRTRADRLDWSVFRVHPDHVDMIIYVALTKLRGNQ